MHVFQTFLIMFGFWLLLSGKFDAFHMTLGLISSLLVAWLSADLLFSEGQRRRGLMGGAALRFLGYIPWLMKEIVLSTLHVTFLAMHPRMRQRIHPQVVRFRTKLKGDLAKVVLANSITLTPGTITIRIEGDEFYVHALSRKTAAGLPGEMEARIAKVFGQ